MTARFGISPAGSGFSVTVAVIVSAVGGFIFFGRTLGLPILGGIDRPAAEMITRCALGLFLGGGALSLLGAETPRRWARCLGLAGAAAVLLLGALTMVEDYFGARLGLASLGRGGTGHAGPGIAVNMVMVGAALVFLGLERIWTSQAFSFAAGLLALSNLTRLGLNGGGGAEWWPALYPGASFLLLSAGLQGARPSRGWMATMQPERAGGRMARRMFLAAAAVPVVLAGLRTVWQKYDWLATEPGAAWFALASTGLFTWLIWFNARTLHSVQEKVRHRERLYLVLSQCNQCIAQVNERDVLFARLCEIAVDLGGFRMAWIGLADKHAERVRPMAHAGVEDGFLSKTEFILRDEPGGQMAAAIAVREGRSVICNRVETDPCMAAVKSDALARGYRSAASFPLQVRGETVGCYTLYTDEPDFFDADEVKLLEEVAADISFALRQIENDADRRRVEAEKARLGAELKTIFDSVPALIFYKDSAHRHLRANAASLRAFGRPAEEVIGRTDAELGLANAAQTARDEDAIVSSGQPKLKSVEPIVTSAGTRWFLVDRVPLREESGEVTGVIGLALDITEQRRAEEALRQREADFRASFLSTAVGQVQADPTTGRYLRVNPKFCEMTGYSEEELLGMSFREVTHPEDRDADNAAHEQLLSGQMAELVREKRYLRRDGRTVWVSISASLIRDADGRPERTLAVLLDITARKAAEEAVRAAELKYRILVEQSIVGIYIIQGERFVYGNPRMLQVLGFSLAELTSRPLFDFIAEEDRHKVSENIRRRLEGEVQSIRYDVRMLRRDGSLLHVDTCGSRAEYEGEPAIIGTLLDVTEQRKLEERLLQAQKMEAIGQLAGGIAHDFNNLLTAIVGNTRLALDDLPEDHPAREALGEIEIASNRASDLVRRILTFSRRETPSRKPVRLQSIAEEALKLLRATFPATVELRLRCTGAPAVVLADATQVQQVIMNLGTNASHAMKGRGVLELDLSTIDVDGAEARAVPDLQPGRYALLKVSDSGCGMEPATLERIFEPFFTTKAMGEGTGLGLSVVHGIMKTHDGAVTAYSQPGQGTVFRLYFPVMTQDYAMEPGLGAPSRSARGSGQRILFVDDEELLVNLAIETFTRLGYRITAFTKPEEALTAFRAEPHAFDIVLSDLSMPGITGPELAREILRLRPEIPVVIATGYIRAPDADALRGIGIRALLLKPNTVEEMAPIVHRLLMRTAPGPFIIEPPLIA